MAKKKGNSMDIPDERLESLARVFLPIMQEYLSSEQGQKDYAEWMAKKQLNNKNKQEKSRLDHRDIPRSYKRRLLKSLSADMVRIVIYIIFKWLSRR